MPTVTINVSEFGTWLREMLGDQIKRDLHAMRTQVAREVAARIEATASELTIERDHVFRSAFLAGWQSEQTLQGADVFNDTPYAGVLELGATWKPGRPPPLEPLIDWVRGKLVPAGAVPLDEVESVAWAIRQKMIKEGLPPRFILRDSSDEAHVPRFIRDAVRRYLPSAPVDF